MIINLKCIILFSMISPVSMRGLSMFVA